MQMVAFPELVVGDPLAEMVNRVEGNVSGKPVQHFRQNKIAAAVDRPFEVTPAPGTTGVGPPEIVLDKEDTDCLLYTSPSPRDVEESRMPSSA